MRLEGKKLKATMLILFRYKWYFNIMLLAIWKSIFHGVTNFFRNDGYVKTKSVTASRRFRLVTADECAWADDSLSSRWLSSLARWEQETHCQHCHAKLLVRREKDLHFRRFKLSAYFQILDRLTKTWGCSTISIIDFSMSSREQFKNCFVN